MSTEAMKLALEALNKLIIGSEYEDAVQAEDAIKALEEALAKQEQGEPVAWGMEGKDGFIFDVICPAEHEREEGGYTTPLYTTPQQRTWVGLTDDDKVLIKHDANFNQFMTVGEYADRVQQLTEARLKDKNNA